MRRRSTDLHIDTATELGIFDGRLLDSITGHIAGGRREQLSQEKWRREVLEPARQIRDKFWSDALSGCSAETQLPQNLTPISPKTGGALR